VAGDMRLGPKNDRASRRLRREAFERAHLAAKMHFKIEANKLAVVVVGIRLSSWTAFGVPPAAAIRIAASSR
jgi:hypothetical protein